MRARMVNGIIVRVVDDEGDFTAMCCNNLAGNRQSQTRPAAARRALKRLEQIGARLRR